MYDKAGKAESAGRGTRGRCDGYREGRGAQRTPHKDTDSKKAQVVGLGVCLRGKTMTVATRTPIGRPVSELLSAIPGARPRVLARRCERIGFHRTLSWQRKPLCYDVSRLLRAVWRYVHNCEPESNHV